MKKIFLFLFLSLFINAFDISAQMRSDLKTEIDKIIYHDTEITFDKIPGFVLGIIYKDSTFIYSYGSLSRDTEISPDKNTIFELGGLSKVFTASLVNLLVEENILNYDSTLNYYLPPEYKNTNTDNITINDLVIHTSGLPKLPLGIRMKENETNNPYANYNKEDLLNFYKDFIPEIENHGSYHYSTLNYALLEIAIESASNTSFENLLKQNIFIPLDMNHSTIAVSEDQIDLIAVGHTIAGKETPIWAFESFAASEGIKSNTEDLIKFLACNLGQTHPTLAKSFVETHIQTIETELNKNAFMAKGWHRVKIKKYYDAILHAGSTSGQRAFMGFIPETQTAVVLLSNSEYTNYGLGFLVLRLINNNWKKKKR